jgi:hypothetical protein
MAVPGIEAKAATGLLPVASPGIEAKAATALLPAAAASSGIQPPASRCQAR